MRTHTRATLRMADPVRRTGASVATALFLTAASLGLALSDRPGASEAADSAAALFAAQDVARTGDVNAFRRLLPPTRSGPDRG